MLTQISSRPFRVPILRDKRLKSFPWERERDRERERERKRERETERDRERQSETDRDRERERCSVIKNNGCRNFEKFLTKIPKSVCFEQY